MPQQAGKNRAQDESCFALPKATYAGKAEINTVDGVKLDFPETWVHLRKSNTEPIIRIYSEGPTQEAADAIGEEILALANSLM